MITTASHLFVIRFNVDCNGTPCYLGVLGGHRQGVTRLVNAIQYRSRANAEVVARDIDAHVVAVPVATFVEGGR